MTCKSNFSSKIYIFAVFVVFLFLSACKNDKKINEKELKMHQRGMDALVYINQVAEQKKQAVVDFVENLNLEERIGQLFIVNIEGNKSFVPVEKNIAGGFLFFSYNIADTPEDIIEFTSSINEYCFFNDKIPPFLAADQEGGLVNRLKKINGPLPSSEKIAQSLSVKEAQDIYSYQAVQMKNLGFNMNLAPVVEVCTESNKDFLDGRSFGDYTTVINYGSACVNAYEQNGIAAVVKHFPGNTNTDPHTGLPEINWNETEMNMQLNSFKNVLNENPAGILMSHARVSGYDENTPACLSDLWVTEKLRNEYGYNGIIFSDDIFMGALALNGYPPEKAAVMAIEAGIDCIMISEKRISGPVQVLCEKAMSDSAFMKKINDACLRIINYKIDCGILNLELNSNWQYVVNSNKNKHQNIEDFYAAKQKNLQLYMEKF